MLKNKHFLNKNKKYNNLGFTLIELLVVVAIIGILASIVLASLNSARSKGKEAAVKSNLKNAIAQAELSYLDNNNYSGACDAIAPMLESIEDRGAVATCYSINNSTWGDIHTRWGATAFLSETGSISEPLEAYSVSDLGVVKWYNGAVTTTGTFQAIGSWFSWEDANTACSLVGGRLPTIEELKSFSDASLEKTGLTFPEHFGYTRFWSATLVPNNPDYVYYITRATGVIDTAPKNITPPTAKNALCVHP